jgi:membrane protein YdbS with pleckstrin-like domain
MKCPACSHEIPADSKFCQSCGAQLLFDASRKKNPERPASSVAQLQSPTDAHEHHGLPEDKTLWEGRFVPQAMYGYWAMAALLTLLTIIGLTYWEGSTQAWWIGIIAIAVLWISLIVLYFYRRVIVHYRLTKLRLFIEHGVLFKKVDRIDIMHLDKTDFTQGPLERLFKVGNLEIESEQADVPKIVLRGIANLRDVADIIDKARLEERYRRGVDIGAASKPSAQATYIEPTTVEVKENLE